ncbi:MAG: ABC transporter permease [Vicinamibacterales bacterium]
MRWIPAFVSSDPGRPGPPALRAGGGLVALLAIAAWLGPALVPFDPATQELALRLGGPTLTHPMGLDELGRDMLARVLAGARVSFLVALVVVAVSAIVGTLVGAVAGYFGGWVDEVLSRAMETLLAFPGLLLAIALVAVLGPSLTNVLAALTVIGWVGYARLVRGQVLRTRELNYVRAAEALGARSLWVLWRHVIPSAAPAVIVQATLGMAGAIMSEAALSFLGLGVQPPTPSWGTMLAGGRAHLLDAPHITVFPGLAMALLVIGFNFLGDGLRDLTDPRRRH